eukprot:1309883-Alexandrium_andersonii.AAC.1
MSASLVGSEMCIRDSGGRGLQRPPPPSPRGYFSSLPFAPRPAFSSNCRSCLLYTSDAADDM